MNNKSKKKFSTKNLVLCGLFTALIAIGTFIKIPIPVVPFTLQFLFTMLAGLLLGDKLGALSVICYTLLGLAGIPVFAEGGGLWYVLKPSFGYIFGFIIATYVTGNLADKKKNSGVPWILISNFVGLLIVYSVGMAYYYIICNYVINTPIGFQSLFIYCFVLAVPGDIFLCIFSAFIAKRLRPIIKRL